MTPIQREEGQGPVYTPEEVAEIEQGYVDRIVSGAQPSDPDRPATANQEYHFGRGLVQRRLFREG